MTSWHADGAALERFAQAPETLDDATASSVELHVAGCARCRAAVAAHADPSALDASWAALADRIDSPRHGVVERALITLGVRSSDAQLVAATPGLRRSWLVSMAALVAAVVAVSRELANPDAFLVVAPLVPLAAVATVFWPGGQPAGEIGAATPAAGFELALRRTIAVLIPSMAVVVAGAAAVPNVDPLAAAWLLPALGLCAVALALGTWMRADVAVGVLAAGWFMTLAGLAADDRAPVRELLPFSSSARFGWLAVAVVAVALTAARRDQFAYSRRSA